MDPGGNLRICNHSPVMLGNIRKRRFVDMANGKAVDRFRTLRPELSASCQAWDTCLGSCRASSEQACGSCSSLDPFVARMLDASKGG
jgi:radical SAM protein with 4Fe4S-binding SPASM domain